MCSPVGTRFGNDAAETVQSALLGTVFSQYSPVGGSSSCLKCRAGTYSSSEGASVCVTYVKEENSARCIVLFVSFALFLFTVFYNVAHGTSANGVTKRDKRNYSPRDKLKTICMCLVNKSDIQNTQTTNLRGKWIKKRLKL